MSGVNIVAAFRRGTVADGHGDAAKWWWGWLEQATGKFLICQVKSSRIGRAAGALILAGLLAGCAGASDFLSKDAEWFSRPSRLFGNDLSVGVAPLSQRKPVAAEDLVSADGLCLNMGTPENPDPNAAPAAVAPENTN